LRRNLTIENIDV